MTGVQTCALPISLNLRAILNTAQRKFTPVEKAQLLDLLPQTAEEAKELIPSLKEITDSDLQNYLDQLQKMAGTV